MPLLVSHFQWLLSRRGNETFGSKKKKMPSFQNPIVLWTLYLSSRWLPRKNELLQPVLPACPGIITGRGHRLDSEGGRAGGVVLLCTPPWPWGEGLQASARLCCPVPLPSPGPTPNVAFDCAFQDTSTSFPPCCVEIPGLLCMLPSCFHPPARTRDVLTRKLRSLPVGSDSGLPRPSPQGPMCPGSGAPPRVGSSAFVASVRMHFLLWDPDTGPPTGAGTGSPGVWPGLQEECA